MSGGRAREGPRSEPSPRRPRPFTADVAGGAAPSPRLRDDEAGAGARSAAGRYRTGRRAPRGSRIRHVTWAGIVRGGLAQCERRWIVPGWARIARAEVDSVALDSHHMSRTFLTEDGGSEAGSAWRGRTPAGSGGAGPRVGASRMSLLAWWRRWPRPALANGTRTGPWRGGADGRVRGVGAAMPNPMRGAGTGRGGAAHSTGIRPRQIGGIMRKHPRRSTPLKSSHVQRGPLCTWEPVH